MDNTWKRIWMTQFAPLENGVARARIYAERSDGATVYVSVNAYEAEFTKEAQMMAIDIANALQTLDIIWKDKEPVDGD